MTVEYLIKILNRCNKDSIVKVSEDGGSTEDFKIIEEDEIVYIETY